MVLISGCEEQVERNKDNIRKTDVIIILAPIEGKKALNVLGLTDPRLFSGGNKLHAKMDPQNCLWHLEYEDGILPQPLKQRFTGLDRLLTFIRGYYLRRNIEIKEIID